MNILLVDENRHDRERAFNTLCGTNHQVEVAANIQVARELMERSLPDILVIDTQISGGTTTQLIKWVRSMQHGTHTYIILTSAESTTQDTQSMLNDQIDDFLKKPFAVGELIFRTDVLSRLCLWTPQLFGQQAQIHEWCDDERALQDFDMWGRAGTLMAKDLSEMFGFRLKCIEVKDTLDWVHLASKISLNEVGRKMEVGLCVGGSKKILSRIASTMLEEADPSKELIQDVLRELANTSAGALKRSGEGEGLELTIGLPENHAFSSEPDSTRIDIRRFVLQNKEAKVRIALQLECARTVSKKITAHELCEGMILSQDLLNTSGILLIRSGTRLTSSNVERIRKLIPDQMFINIAC